MVAFPRRAVAALWRRSGTEWQTEVLRVPPRRAAWSRGQQWLTVAASFLLGVCLASAVLVLVWSREATRADSTEAALARVVAERKQALATADRLDGARARAEAKLAEARAVIRRQQSAGKGIGATAGAAAADAANADEAAREVAAGAGSLAGGAGRVTNAVAALETYVSKTPAGQMDPAYLAAQLAYLDSTTEKLRSDAATVGAAAETVRQARLALSRRIERLRELAERVAAPRRARRG